MIVCCCYGTTDYEIRQAFGPGGSGKCPAGKGCGGCLESVRDIAAQVAHEEPRTTTGNDATESQRSSTQNS